MTVSLRGFGFCGVGAIAKDSEPAETCIDVFLSTSLGLAFVEGSLASSLLMRRRLPVRESSSFPSLVWFLLKTSLSLFLR